MDNPKNCLYTEEHEWVRVEDDCVVVGITHFAQDQMGDIVYVEFPKKDTDINKQDPVAVINSPKNAADVLSPVTGTVTAVNVALEDTPETINEDPFEDGWLFKVKYSDKGELEGLMDAEAYTAFIENQEEE